MKKIIVLIIFNLIYIGLSNAQISQNDYYKPTYEDSLEIALANLNTQLDSLFKLKQYKTIVSEINTYPLTKMPYRWQKDLNQQLIASYYKLDDTAKSNQILRESFFYNDTVFSLMNAFTFISPASFSMLSYVNIPSNRDRIEQLTVIDFKNKVKDITEPNNALQILRFLLQDQFIRRDDQSFNFDNNEQDLKKQFEFFKKADKIFSVKEVGEALHAFQFLLFAHDGVKVRREYYLEMIKKGAEEKRCGKENIANFILRTQMMEEGQSKFLKNLREREDIMSKKYNLPNYHFQVY